VYALCVPLAAGELDSVQVMIDVPQQRSGPEGPGFVVQVGAMQQLAAAVLHALVVDAVSVHSATCSLLQTLRLDKSRRC
jgi:hypothetical protein